MKKHHNNQNNYAPICIIPISNKMAQRAEAVYLLNGFQKLKLNFTSFLLIVQNINPKYEEYKNIKTLISFWNLRAFNCDLIDEMNLILETLKSE
jgi:hypothetical protein